MSNLWNLIQFYNQSFLCFSINLIFFFYKRNKEFTKDSGIILTFDIRNNESFQYVENIVKGFKFINILSEDEENVEANKELEKLCLFFKNKDTENEKNNDGENKENNNKNDNDIDNKNNNKDNISDNNGENKEKSNDENKESDEQNNSKEKNKDSAKILFIESLKFLKKLPILFILGIETLVNFN